MGPARSISYQKKHDDGRGNALASIIRRNMNFEEKEYNNRARVPGHPAVIAGWMRDAAAFRAAHPPEVLAYGTGPREAMDLFLPAEIRGVAMFFHGGYWQALDRTSASHCAAGLLEHGIAVGVPSYDLCPAVPLARIVAQAEAAALVLHARLGRPMLVCGHSAGGHLSALLMARLPANIVAAALPVSGLFWLEPLVPTSLNTALGLDPATARDLSPALLPSPGRPLHCAAGGDESGEFLRQSREFSALWGGSWEALPGLDHFTVLAPLSQADHPLTMTAATLAWQASGTVSKI
jgi:arylformamidase